jgi:hypothetical protein
LFVRQWHAIRPLHHSHLVGGSRYERSSAAPSGSDRHGRRGKHPSRPLLCPLPGHLGADYTRGVPACQRAGRSSGRNERLPRSPARALPALRPPPSFSARTCGIYES